MNKWKIGWGLTNKCNMNCEFCYSSTARKSKAEVSLADSKDFINRNYQHIESINYGTGENALLPQWFDLIEFIKKRAPNIKQALTTNGYLSQALYENFKAKEAITSLSEIDVSIDFADEKKHNAIRGNSNAYLWALKTLEICNQYGIIPTIVTIGINSTLDVNNIVSIFELATSYNAFVRINIFRPNSKQKIKPLDYSVLKTAIRYIVQNYKIVSLSDILFSAIINQIEFIDNTGKTSLRILPNGKITISTYLIDEKWWKEDLTTIDLSSEGLSMKLLGDNLNPPIPEKCELCEIKKICKGGAIDRRLIWFNSLYKNDPYCPYNNNDSIESWKMDNTSHNSINKKEGVPSIHDGYLPTLIFRP